MSKFVPFLGFYLVTCLWSCEKDVPISDNLLEDVRSGPTPYHLKIPEGFGDYFLEESNRLTYEGIALGKRLFYDPLLSRNQNVSCGSCHLQENAFSDPRQLSVGTHGEQTSFHSMPLFNIAWMEQFFWNGRAFTREAQAIQPVLNPLELDMSWDEVIERLSVHPEYPELFKSAFGEVAMDSTLVTKALVQFEMTLVSANSKYDKWARGEAEFTKLEQEGYEIFVDFQRGDCIHCHMITNENLADNLFHNNGLDDEANVRPGLFEVTGKTEDYGKFKTPSLRNLAFTAPYMHDGRFKTLRDVIRFYSYEVHDYPGVDPLMEFKAYGGVALDSNEGEFDALIAFLHTLTDSNLVQNPQFADPNDL